VLAEISELISPKTPTKTGVLTITGMLPSPIVTEPLRAEPAANPPRTGRKCRPNGKRCWRRFRPRVERNRV
jgi:hypothetical protein